uniref:KH domain-containing protein n=1 Tax=Macrostomum lignano TaxID=282301 RepID=A0A1I8IPF7_9PLAT
MTELVDEAKTAGASEAAKKPTESNNATPASNTNLASVNGTGDNNNDNNLTNNNLSDDVKETQSQQPAIDNRVSNWLAKNCQYQQNQQQTAEPAEEDDEIDENDSGRHSDSNNAQISSNSANKNTNAKTVSERNNRTIVRGASPVPGDETDIVHQFLIPNRLGGSMVGTGGRNISYIRSKSGASVWISRNFFDKKTQVVNIRGPVECVKIALQVIKKRFPELDVKPINTAVPIQRNPALQPTMCQLSLPVGATIDVTVCAMSRGTTVFLQQPTHPSFHHLEKMDATIKRHYGGGVGPGSIPQQPPPCLPRPVNPGAVCIAPFGNSWHRAIIADVFPEEDAVLMKYLDWAAMRKCHTEMMHLPFQAVEAHLAYVSPAISTAAGSADVDVQLDSISRSVHQGYLTNKRVKCQVVYFNDVNQPCVYLYTKEPQQSQWRFVQEDLVQAGLMHWFQMPRSPPQLPVSSASATNSNKISFEAGDSAQRSGLKVETGARSKIGQGQARDGDRRRKIEL